MKKIIAGLLLMNCLALSAASAGGRRAGEISTPRLLAPSEKVDLTGKESLEFRWGTESSRSFDHFDFRLYKGTETYEKNLILKKEVPPRQSSVSIESAAFEPGETYAWSLRTVGSAKSRSSFSIFTVKKG